MLFRQILTFLILLSVTYQHPNRRFNFVLKEKPGTSQRPYLYFDGKGYGFYYKPIQKNMADKVFYWNIQYYKGAKIEDDTISSVEGIYFKLKDFDDQGLSMEDKRLALFKLFGKAVPPAKFTGPVVLVDGDETVYYKTLLERFVDNKDILRRQKFINVVEVPENTYFYNVPPQGHNKIVSLDDLRIELKELKYLNEE
jgi:hypothetical protein